MPAIYFVTAVTLGYIFGTKVLPHIAEKGLKTENSASEETTSDVPPASEATADEEIETEIATD